MKLRPWHLALIATAAIIGMTVLVTGGTQPGAVKTDGTVITRTVSAIEPNATATFEVTLLEGGDAAHESEHIFESLDHPSIASVSLDTATLVLTVEYDGSTLTDVSIRERLIASGYVTPTLAEATETQPTADGAGRTIHLTAGDRLDPTYVRTPAGVPLTLTFSAGTGHLATVSIPTLGITQDITVEGASITIPAPATGTYELVCAEGYTDGTLIVE